MRTLLLLVAGLLITLPALAAENSTGPDEPVETAVTAASAPGDCCHPICVIQGCLKHRPFRQCLPHLYLEPLDPCDPCIEIAPACHKPLALCTPEQDCSCLPALCHKPLLVFKPLGVCGSKCGCNGKEERDNPCGSCRKDEDASQDKVD